MYTQSPIIKNGPIRNNAEIVGKFKELTLSRSKIRNEQFPSKKRSAFRLSKLRNN